MSIYTVPYQDSRSSLAYSAPGAYGAGAAANYFLEATTPQAVQTGHSPCISCRIANGFRVLVRLTLRLLG